MFHERQKEVPTAGLNRRSHTQYLVLFMFFVKVDGNFHGKLPLLPRKSSAASIQLGIPVEKIVTLASSTPPAASPIILFRQSTSTIIFRAFHGSDHLLRAGSRPGMTRPRPVRFYKVPDPTRSDPIRPDPTRSDPIRSVRLVTPPDQPRVWVTRPRPVRFDKTS